MGLIRFVFLGFLFLTAIYFLISIYSRSVRREKLENRWDEKNPGGGDPGARDTYIEQGMVEYEGGLRKKLIWLVYIVPPVIVMVILYLTSFYEG
jgi:ABC-type Na+ efflux pump permease subunit